MNGIREGEEVKYPFSVHNLMVPAKMSLDPNWVKDCIRIDMSFYKRVMKAVREMKKFIVRKVEDVEKEKFEVMSVLAGIITDSTLKEGESTQSEVLPGCRVYNILAPLKDSPSAALTFFSTANSSAVLKSNTFKVTGPLIDSTIKVLEEYQQLINEHQKNTSQLQKEFESEADKILRQENVTPERKRFLSFLCNIHKRLVNTTLQHAVQSINALDDFINAGIKP